MECMRLLACKRFAGKGREEVCPGFGYRACLVLSERDDDGSGGDKDASDEFAGGESFAEQGPGEQDDEDDAELVDGSDARGLSFGEGVEVADPGKACGDA